MRVVVSLMLVKEALLAAVSFSMLVVSLTTNAAFFFVEMSVVGEMSWLFDVSVLALVLVVVSVLLEASVVVSSMFNKDSVAHSTVDALLLDEALAFVDALVLVRASASILAEYYKEVVK